MSKAFYELLRKIADMFPAAVRQSIHYVAELYLAAIAIAPCKFNSCVSDKIYGTRCSV